MNKEMNFLNEIKWKNKNVYFDVFIFRNVIIFQ